jgi:hypothetical protein
LSCLRVQHTAITVSETPGLELEGSELGCCGSGGVIELCKTRPDETGADIDLAKNFGFFGSRSEESSTFCFEANPAWVFNPELDELVIAKFIVPTGSGAAC